MIENCINCKAELRGDDNREKNRMGFICEKCFDQQRTKIINSLDNFRKTNEFGNKEQIIKKMAWTIEERNKWLGQSFNNQNTFPFYYKKGVEDLQLMLLEQLIQLMDSAGFNYWSKEAKQQHTVILKKRDKLKK
ncbi:hypothetical protein J4438_00785 [Candidatus Woesearchaeota archaeon]|nr:hypothetical protein [Candidatus Woesearchaeota archaeon]